MGMFFEEHAKLLSDFARVSQSTGARADYVQGGGGNTSVKLPGGLMAHQGLRLLPVRYHVRIRPTPCWTARLICGSSTTATESVCSLRTLKKQGSARAKADVQPDRRPCRRCVRLSRRASIPSSQTFVLPHAQRLCQLSPAAPTACRRDRGTGVRRSGLHLGLGALHRSRRKPDLRHPAMRLRRVEQATGKRSVRHSHAEPRHHRPRR